MKVITKDILTVEKGTIVHQINAHGVIGAGLALAIREKWPKVYERIQRHRRMGGGCLLKLGSAYILDVTDTLNVANLVGQIDYGVDRQHTDYEAVARCLSILGLMTSAAEDLQPVYLPYGMGAGLGGGDWNVIYKIIQSILPDAVICRKP